ncbi:hypothetical protein Krac_3148 [Ktedonobacter racemifer DSM 44963]|uniref:Uncharacterized protein n=1 Tax=Ktedonobacter racemifer DSM 44963 TaxID=485913 RepID=D6U0K2_KTERA|nr:hypothetical protein Krac_3148 [Ktedonobacter racemifer DSM 44963]
MFVSFAHFYIMGHLIPQIQRYLLEQMTYERYPQKELAHFW